MLNKLKAAAYYYSYFAYYYRSKAVLNFAANMGATV